MDVLTSPIMIFVLGTSSLVIFSILFYVYGVYDMIFYGEWTFVRDTYTLTPTYHEIAHSSDGTYRTGRLDSSYVKSGSYRTDYKEYVAYHKITKLPKYRSIEV